MDTKPKITRRRNAGPGKARVRSQQVKVSEEDREKILALARRDGLTPSTWCYEVIMQAVRKEQVARPESPSTEDDEEDVAERTLTSA